MSAPTTALFRRGLADGEWAALEAMLGTSAANWWQDLLSLWKPSGKPARLHGLRLALRHGALNFYRRGQSVGRIGFRRTRRGVVIPRMGIHGRYVEPGCVAGYRWFGHLDEHYPSKPELLRWIENSAPHQGPEKAGVDDVVGRNAGVIDLEMATPDNALRIDIVSLQEGLDRPCLVLWEAKPLHSAELCSSTPEPPIVKQVAGYRAFCEANRKAIETAYMLNCRALLRFADWAGKIGDLSALVSKGAEVGVCLDPEVRLVLFRVVKHGADGNRSLMPISGNWPHHRAKLARLTFREAEDPMELDLNGLANRSGR